MKAVSCNQRNGGHRKALCPGAPQGPVWYHPPPNSSGLEFPPPGHPCSDLPRSLNTGNPHQRWENAMPFFFFFNIFIYFIFGCIGSSLLCAFSLVSLVAASGGYSLLQCAGFSLWGLLLLWSTGSRCAGFSSCGSWAPESRLSSCGTWAQ